MGLLTGLNAPRFSQYTSDLFTGTGSQTTFTLSRVPPTASALIVTIDGAKQISSTYSISGSTIIFTEAPASGAVIECVPITAQGVAIIPSDNSVTTSSLVDGSVTTAKHADGSVTTAKLADGSVSATKLDALGTGVGAAVIPTGTTAQRPTTPVNGMIRKNSSTGYLEYYDPNTSSWVGVGALQATGGTENTYTVNGNVYKSHTFTTSGSFVVTSGSKLVDVMLVAGGGGGAQDTAGGGGAGGMLVTTASVVSGTYSIVIGGGGARANSSLGYSGSNTTGFGLTAIGGGGGSGSANSATSALSGGSGGGGGSGRGGGAGTAGQGFAGESSAGAAGGGGASEPGGTDGVGFGGDGRTNDFRTGTPTFYAGGGAGQTGTGGDGGGGTNGGYAATSNMGVANTGGGGSAFSGSWGGGGDGGSGIVVIRYQIG